MFLASGRCEPAVPAAGNDIVSVGGWDGRLTPAARQNLVANYADAFAATLFTRAVLCRR